jgi:hypothetical protein
LAGIDITFPKLLNVWSNSLLGGNIKLKPFGQKVNVIDIRNCQLNSSAIDIWK